MRATWCDRRPCREQCDVLNHPARRVPQRRANLIECRACAVAPQLPTDIEALQALIAAARAERDAAVVERDQALSQIDRLRHLLRQLQRPPFGRRSEKLDPEQLLLALEDRASRCRQRGRRRQEGSGGRTRARRQTSRQSRRAPRPSAACRCDDRAGRYQLPVLPRAHACDRRRDLAAARRDPGAVPGDRDAPSQICLPGVRAGGGCGAGAGTADQGRTADRGDGRLRAGRQIRLALAALSTSPDAARARPRHQAGDPGLLGRLCGRGA